MQLVAEAIIDSQPEAADEEAATCVQKPTDADAAEVDVTAAILAAVEPRPEPACPALHVYDPEPEPAPAAAPEAEAEEDEGPDVIPVLTEEILAKMFANMLANGITLEEFAGGSPPSQLGPAAPFGAWPAPLRSGAEW